MSAGASVVTSSLSPASPNPRRERARDANASHSVTKKCKSGAAYTPSGR